MRIALLSNIKDNAPKWDGMPEDQWDDLDGYKTINLLLKALEAGGHEAAFFEAQLQAPHNLIEKLLDYQPDLCFNIAEGHFGDSRESQIPAVLEMLRIPYTGSRVLALSLALDKPMTKRVLTYHGLPTPIFQVFESVDDPIDDDLLDADGSLRHTMFVKPSREGTSIGATVESVVRTVDELRKQVEMQLTRYQQPILVEQFIQGREVTVGMVGNLAPTAARRLNERVLDMELPETLHFFPILESNIPQSESGVYSSRLKTTQADAYSFICPAPLTDAQNDELYRLAAAVFKVIGCRDVSRVDFRLDESDNDKPYILEVNPLPGLTPNFSDITLQADTEGWTHAQLVNAIVQAAAIRHGLNQEKMPI